MDTTQQSPVILSLCPGLLGLERGLTRAIGNLRIAAYVEIETFIIANLIAGMESGLLDPAPVWTDVKTFDPRPFRGKIHGIIGGYPCQPFSTAGSRKGDSDPRHLWPFIAYHIEVIRPRFCFFENVAGHLSMGYETVRRELQQLGYTVKEGIFSAEEIGAPHQRKRLFILALADRHSVRSGNSAGNSNAEGKTVEKSEQWEERHKILRQRMRAILGFSCTELANALRDNGTEMEKKKGTQASDRNLSAMARRGEMIGSQQDKDLTNMIGSTPVLLNPAWVAQLMGTTLENIFYMPLATQWSNRQQN